MDTMTSARPMALKKGELPKPGNGVKRMTNAELDLWMEKQGIYIPTEEEVRKAKEQGLVKVHRPKKEAPLYDKRNGG